MSANNFPFQAKKKKLCNERLARAHVDANGCSVAHCSGEIGREATYGFLLPRKLLKIASKMPRMAITDPTCIMVQVDQ